MNLAALNHLAKKFRQLSPKKRKLTACVKYALMDLTTLLGCRIVPYWATLGDNAEISCADPYQMQAHLATS